ncbi:hypothetical protein [Isoptericola sp. NPDC019482]|uniref:hypothetical protein n=1 Tax=Isoptericola sp. NPDC019482 TaxID=3154688 RepID=UPI00347DCA53
MPAEISSAFLVKSSGERVQDPFAPRVQVELQFQATEPGEGHPDHWLVGADVTVRSADASAEQYRGSSLFAVGLGAGDPPSPPALVAQFWPHIRADLTAQCSRIAGQTLSLPFELTVEQLTSALEQNT